MKSFSINDETDFLNFSRKISENRIVGFSAQKGTGKTTLCQVLQSSLGRTKNVVLVAFADPLKHIACAAISERDMSPEKKEIPIEGIINSRNVEKMQTVASSYVKKIKKDKDEQISSLVMMRGILEQLPESTSPRVILQTLGTEWGRDCVDKNFWVKLAVAKINDTKKENSIFLVHDMRFDNEAQALRDIGGLCYRLKREGYSSNVDGHASERGVSDSLIDCNVDINYDIRKLLDGKKGLPEPKKDVFMENRFIHVK